MTDTPATAANLEQITFWNDVGGPKWVRYQSLLDRQLDAIGKLTMDAANLRPGESLLDVGCGCGSTSLELARRVGASGSVTGIDISRPMLALARERAAAEGLTNATFAEADAQTHAFASEFDVLYSRFGVMFFDDPVRAFANLRRSLRSGARVAFACWQAIHRNPWMAVPLMAALKHVTVELPTDPTAPGPFAFADAARVSRILVDAGYDGVSVDGRDIDIVLGGGSDLEETTKLVMDLGPMGRFLADATPEQRKLVEAEVREAITGYATPDGVCMPGAIWLVTAAA
ncbi:MAG: class I SAM-dependent methyltransferase [Candidatus Binatia bacterium]